MSWDQGITERKDLPEKFVLFLEEKYLNIVGKQGHLEYITWFGLGEEFYADFGVDNPSLTLRAKDAKV